MNISEALSNPTTIWFIVGLAILLLELAVPGLVLIFFGAGAWITALACFLFDVPLNGQLLIFTISSLLLLLLLRKYIKSKLFSSRQSGKDEIAEELKGKTVEVVEDIAPGKPGKIMLNGTLWTARSDTGLKKGDVAQIIDKESINLTVKPYK